MGIDFDIEVTLPKQFNVNQQINMVRYD